MSTDLDEWLTALGKDTERMFFYFNIIQYAYWGMLGLGYLIMAYVLFGLSTAFYVGVGVAAGAGGGYVLYRLIGERVIRLLFN